MNVELPCPAVFVSGTDTGVGKTIVASALARHLASLGLKVGVMKPIETGVPDPGEPGEDARLLSWAANSADPEHLIAPCRFKEPVAPTQAASLEKTHIDPGELEVSLQKLAEGKDFVIVEGAGGLMVPVRGGYLMADLVRQFNLPLLIVSRTTLGTLNHTLLTVFAAQSIGIQVAGIILNGMAAEPDLAAREAPHLLAMIASADLLGVLPEVDGSQQECVEKLAEVIAGLQTRGWLLQSLGLGTLDGRLK
jgi:dethiobiotin synthetase